MYSHYQRKVNPVKARKYVQGESMENIVVYSEDNLLTEDGNHLEANKDYQPKEGDMVVFLNGIEILYPQEVFVEQFSYLY